MVPTQGGSILYVCTKFKAGSSFVQQLSGGPKFCPAADPFPGAQDGQNLISCRRSLPLPTDSVWWRSLRAISSYRGNRPTNTQTPPQTHKHTHRQDRLQYTAQCIVIDPVCGFVTAGGVRILTTASARAVLASLWALFHWLSFIRSKVISRLSPQTQAEKRL